MSLSITTRLKPKGKKIQDKKVAKKISIGANKKIKVEAK
jgi:hypothetical protein